MGAPNSVIQMVLAASPLAVITLRRLTSVPAICCHALQGSVTEMSTGKVYGWWPTASKYGSAPSAYIAGEERHGGDVGAVVGGRREAAAHDERLGVGRPDAVRRLLEEPGVGAPGRAPGARRS